MDTLGIHCTFFEFHQFNRIHHRKKNPFAFQIQNRDMNSDSLKSRLLSRGIIIRDSNCYYSCPESEYSHKRRMTLKIENTVGDGGYTQNPTEDVLFWLQRPFFHATLNPIGHGRL
jgi:hypothetical protein